MVLVDVGDEAHLAEVTLLLLRLLGQDVTVEGVLSLDLTCSGERETLLGAGISLYFRHLFGFKKLKNMCGCAYLAQRATFVKLRGKHLGGLLFSDVWKLG